jgi:hypothetical protein
MSESFVPPAGVATAAKRALGWIADGHAGDGFTSTGRTRASQLANREGISADTINRMVSFFARHEVDKKAKGFNQGEKGFPSPGRVAWDAWGGDAGKFWAESVAAKLNREKSTMAQDFAKSFAEIVKFNKNDDGTLTVYGKATSDDLDIDLQICDNDWLKKAMPDWFKSGGNIREQHSSIAAGVATDYEEKADGFYITANVVDPVSCKKVEAKVLKGFSIGIKAPRVIRDEKAANGRIIDGQIVEVSLVDRPANPTCQLVLAKSVGGESTLTQVEELIEKRDFTAEEREDAADAGQALPDGSYPIKTIADLKNAIQAFGRAKNPAKVKQHIITRARALGAIDQLPEGWNVKKSPLLDVILELHEKATTPDSVKFDDDSYEAVIKSIATVLVKETGTDEDEDAVIEALKHAFDSQFANKDADGDDDSDDDADGSAGCTCDGCKACKDAGGCKSTPCSKCMMAKSALVGKCLECGCHQASNSHGQTQIVVANTGEKVNVTTAATLDTSGSLKSAEGEEAPVEPAHETVVEEIKAEADKVEAEVEHVIEEIKTEILDEKAVAAIVEKAVKSATEIVKTEINSHEAALKAANEKLVALESELATAKSAVLNGGPAKTGRKPNQDTNELLATALDYRLKAAATTDPTLVKGYKALEAEYLEKANKLNK